jgi:hypothetical protein
MDNSMQASAAVGFNKNIKHLNGLLHLEFPMLYTDSEGYLRPLHFLLPKAIQKEWISKVLFWLRALRDETQKIAMKYESKAMLENIDK